MKLNELRRSSATMPKQSAADQLLAKAKSIPKSELASYFVSFTKLEKLGINPGSTYDTPNGIYAYPLAYVIKRIKAGMKELSPHMKENGIRLSSVLPFAGGSPFINIFKANGNVLDLANQEECWHQYDRIARESGLSDGETRFKLPYTYYQKTGARAFWGITLYLANGKQKAPVSSPDIAKRWNTVLRKFGFDGIVDSKGQGVIHSNEPTQAVFTQLQGLVDNVRITNTKSGSAAKTATMNGDLNEMPWVTTVIAKIVNTTEFKTLFKSAENFIRAGDKDGHFPENVLKSATNKFDSMFSDLVPLPDDVKVAPIFKLTPLNFGQAFLKSLQLFTGRREALKSVQINSLPGKDEGAVTKLLNDFKKEILQRAMSHIIIKRITNHYDETYDANTVLDILGDMKPIFIKKALISLLYIAGRANDAKTEVNNLLTAFENKYGKATMETVLGDRSVTAVLTNIQRSL